MSSVSPCANSALPVSLDVNVTVSRSQSVILTDLSTPVFVNSTGPFSHGNRIAFYSSISALSEDWATTDQPYIAGQLFFAQNPRPAQLAVAQAYDVDQAAYLTCGSAGTLAAFQGVNDGGFQIIIDGVTIGFDNLDFTLVASLDDVATIISAVIVAIGICVYDSDTNQFIFTTNSTGDLSTITVLSFDQLSTTDISGALYLNGQLGVGIAVQGYSFVSLTDELNRIYQATLCTGQFVYGWAFEVAYRVTATQIIIATWAESQQQIAVALTTNDTAVYNPVSTTDLMAQTHANGYEKTFTFYDEIVEEYPEMGVFAPALSVDYSAPNSVRNSKFKNITGMATVPLNETQWAVIESKRGNSFTLMQNGARTVRGGTMAADGWYIDQRTSVDNFVNELTNAIYNVLLTNDFLPYTGIGIALLANAEQQICQRYVFNGALSGITITDSNDPTGISIKPPFTITFPPLQNVTLAQRAARSLFGNVVSILLTDAINSINVSVNIEN